MAKGKSSASSGTRKKHARKAAAGEDYPLPLVNPPSKKVKGKKGEKLPPRVKQYIPPSKPAPVQPDPLDSFGLASTLDKDLVVILRRLGKKDAVTRGKALEELRVWVDKDESSGSVDMIPVWLHHFPSLSLHPFRRIRLLASSLHSHFLDIAEIRSAIYFYIRETADASQSEAILGSWCLSAFDADRTVSREAYRSWSKNIEWKRLRFLNEAGLSTLSLEDDRLADGVSDVICRALLESDSFYSSVFPPAPAQYADPLPPNARRAQGRGPQVSRINAEDEAPRKSEMDEESEDDRRARLRISSLGSLKWLLESYRSVNSRPDYISHLLQRILSDAMAFTSLHHARHPSFAAVGQVAYGSGQPLVRRSAWNVVQSLAPLCKDDPSLAPYLTHLSACILGSAWVEPDPTVRLSMWEPVLTFLTKIPEAWTLASQSPLAPRKSEDDDSETASEEEEEHSSDGDETSGYLGAKSSERPTSDKSPYRQFLEFLKLGCGGSPVEGYPTLVVILSTIPGEILPLSTSSLEELFTSFWAAVDGRALFVALQKERRDNAVAFLNALTECVAVYARRLWGREPPVGKPSQVVAPPGTESSGNQVAMTLVREQWARIWGSCMDGRLQLSGSLLGAALGKGLMRLSMVDPELFRISWEPVASTSLLSSSISDGVDLVDVLASIDDQFRRLSSGNPLPQNQSSSLLLDWSREAISSLQRNGDLTEGVLDRRARTLSNMLRSFGSRLSEEPEIANLLDQLVDQELSSLSLRLSSASSVSLFLSYVSIRPGNAQSAWNALLRSIGSADYGVEPSPHAQLLSTLLDETSLPSHLRAHDELDELTSRILQTCLENINDRTEAVRDSDADLLRRLLLRADFFLSDETVKVLRSRLYQYIVKETEDLLTDPSPPAPPLRAALHILVPYIEQGASHEEFYETVLPSVFLLSNLILDEAQSPRDLNLAKSVWKSWMSKASATTRAKVVSIIAHELKDLIIRTDIPYNPITIFDLGSRLVSLGTLSTTDLLPDQQFYEASLSTVVYSPHSSLSILDPLLPSETSKDSARQLAVYDLQGLSAYARAAWALLHAFTLDRQVARENLWITRHIAVLEIFAQDSLAVPSSPSSLLAPQRQGFDDDSKIHTIVTESQQAVVYILSSASRDISVAWHQDLIACLQKNTVSPVDQLSALICRVYAASLASDDVLASRIFHVVLRGILREATTGEADLWLGLAQSIQDKATQTAIAIILCLVHLNLESPRLDRYRNELASRLSGVNPSKANTQGAKLLRLLNASAPSPESDVVFLPQQRTVFMVQAFQKWITGDEDLVEEVESQVAAIFVHVAPILQSVPGAHWDLVGDLIELNLENASLLQDETLVVLYRTLKLVLAVDEFSASNKGLREVWSERQPSIYALIKGFLITSIDGLPKSIPREICRGLVVDIAASATTALVDEHSFPSLCHLLRDSSLEVQIMAHGLLHEAAKKHTEKLVLEVEVDVTGDVKPALPAELISILHTELKDEDDTPSSQREQLSHLLAWMIVFDLFVDASPRVKSAYLEQLRDAQLVEAYLLPALFTLLHIGVSGKPFPFDMWAVDQFYVSLYDESLPTSVQVLAAHVFYRALLSIPSLIRTWWLDCKDRQLSGAVASFIGHQYSPMIVQKQLSNVKNPGVLQELQNENLSIKVVPAMRDIIVSYLIDDQQMEIALRFPSDYPLHSVDVKDVNRVGVQESKWRSWLFNVQQIAQNGLVVDALHWFKKNVASHFEGKVECAICYSIISVTDRTLPTKPCKTCKNRFHSSCLFKWFNTSHSSSCPLCRSDIM